MEIKYPQIGICGLSCRLCPRYQTEAASRCFGCKSRERLAAGCPFITCAIKKVGVEYCGDCPDHACCEKWTKHREAGRTHDSFKCYQSLEPDIEFIRANGIQAFDEEQAAREALLIRLINDFNEGRSKSYYCIAATVMGLDELENALVEATAQSNSLTIKEKSGLMHSILDRIAGKRDYNLSLRK